MRISDWSSDVCSSDLVRKEPDKKDVAELKCSCGYLLAPYMRQCPGCGKERVRLSLVEPVPGVMVEVNPDSLLPAYLRNREPVRSEGGCVGKGGGSKVGPGWLAVP